LDRAFANFFAGRASYPQFKRRSEREGSFVIRDLTVKRLNRKWGVVTVPKVGQVRFRISRLWAEIEAATSARVTHRNGRWHIAFTTPPAEKVTAATGAVVGIDRGVKNTLATSEGNMIQAPSLTEGELSRLEQKMPDGTVLRADPKNTSRTCAACGHCAPGNRESQAVFECIACGHAAHADTNAAVNILDRALSTTTAPGHGVSGRASPAVLAGSANQPAA